MGNKHESVGEVFHKAWDHASEHVDDAMHHINAHLRGDLPMTPAHILAQIPSKKAILSHMDERSFLKSVAPKLINDAPLPTFDPGVLNNELLAMELFPEVDADGKMSEDLKGNIKEGTYGGTQVALTQVYAMIEQHYSTYFDVLAIEPTLPRYLSLEDKKELFQWSCYPNNGDGTPAQYPPHLHMVPPDQSMNPFRIFSKIGLLETQVILQKITPDDGGFLGKTKVWLEEKGRATAYGGEPGKGMSIEEVVKYNKFHRKIGTDIANGGNIGLLDDWYGDRRFADQALTGVNPTTLTKASEDWINDFVTCAKAQGEAEWAVALQQAPKTDLYVQDVSYLREAIGVKDPSAALNHQQPGSNSNWGCAAVTLYQLHPDGQLHPCAICVDWLGSLETSVTIFNRRLSPSDSTASEKNDWAWRYAKTAAQVSDWMVHEMGVHLTHAHLVEEATIVAANRTFPMKHPVYRLLSPHWYKTLSLNAAARASLVPQVIVDLVGLSPDQSYNMIKHHFDTFDFVGGYVPNDLSRRGFPNTEEGLAREKYRNCVYAKDMLALWKATRRYVKSMLLVYYDKSSADQKIAEDLYLQNWANECRGPGHLHSFPEKFDTLDSLVDAVTMCIHIAAPFHSAVNYLQNFYQAFVAARPPALCRAPPTSLSDLKSYREADLVASLPINRQREWLLAAQVPWLLSFKVDDDRSLLNFAASQWHVYKYKRDAAEMEIRDISKLFYEDLQGLQTKFFWNSRAQSEGAIPYMVLDPGLTAVSILI